MATGTGKGAGGKEGAKPTESEKGGKGSRGKGKGKGTFNPDRSACKTHLTDIYGGFASLEVKNPDTVPRNGADGRASRVPAFRDLRFAYVEANRRSSDERRVEDLLNPCAPLTSVPALLATQRHDGLATLDVEFAPPPPLAGIPQGPCDGACDSERVDRFADGCLTNAVEGINREVGAHTGCLTNSAAGRGDSIACDALADTYTRYLHSYMCCRGSGSVVDQEKERDLLQTPRPSHALPVLTELLGKEDSCLDPSVGSEKSPQAQSDDSKQEAMLAMKGFEKPRIFP